MKTGKTSGLSKLLRSVLWIWFSYIRDLLILWFTIISAINMHPDARTFILPSKLLLPSFIIVYYRNDCNFQCQCFWIGNAIKCFIFYAPITHFPMSMFIQSIFNLKTVLIYYYTAAADQLCNNVPNKFQCNFYQKENYKIKQFLFVLLKELFEEAKTIKLIARD